MKLKKRAITLAVIVAMIVTMFAPMSVSAASSGGALVKSVKAYNYNTYTKKWELSSKTQYKYEKAYPVEIKTVYYSSDDLKVEKLKYKMKKNKPKKANHYADSNRKDETRKYNKKGLLTSNKWGNFFKRNKWTKAYKYNKYGFATQYVYSYSYKYSDGYKDNGKTTYKYAYTMKKGLPKTMTSTRIYDDGTVSGYKTEVKYNGKGLGTAIYDVWSDGTRTQDYAVKYKMKKGKVSTATLYYFSGGKKQADVKYVFTYYKDKTSKQRNANMINSIVLYSNSWGTYNWY